MKKIILALICTLVIGVTFAKQDCPNNFHNKRDCVWDCPWLQTELAECLAKSDGTKSVDTCKAEIKSS